MQNVEAIGEKWLRFIQEFSSTQGDVVAKWDVFAECISQLPVNEQARFVNYENVEVEKFVNLEEETDTLCQERESG